MAATALVHTDSVATHVVLACAKHTSRFECDSDVARVPVHHNTDLQQRTTAHRPHWKRLANSAGVRMRVKLLKQLPPEAGQGGWFKSRCTNTSPFVGNNRSSLAACPGCKDPMIMLAGGTIPFGRLVHFSLSTLRARQTKRV